MSPITSDDLLLQLADKTNSFNVLTQLNNDSHTKKTIKLLWLQVSNEPIRSEVIKKHPAITLYFFLEAMSTRDFKQLKTLLPYLYQLRIDELKTAYIESAICLEQVNKKAKASKIKINIENCQKNLINKNDYDDMDVWLLVMFSLIHPYASILPLCHLDDIKPPYELTKHCKLSENSQSEYDQFQAEINAATEKFETIKQFFSTKENPIRMKRRLEETSEQIFSKQNRAFFKQKQAMENNNLLFNIINVFAWLPLLLTNLKRLCYGESLRLFHYVGLDYNKKVMTKMLEILSTPEPTLIENILSDNRADNEAKKHKLKLKYSLSSDEMSALCNYLVHDRDICTIQNGDGDCWRYRKGSARQLTRYEVRNNALSFIIPEIETALQKYTFEEIITQLEYTNYQHKNPRGDATPIRGLRYFIDSNCTVTQHSWQFTEEELTCAERGRILDADNLYKAVILVSKNEFDDAYRSLLMKMNTTLGETIAKKLQGMLQNKIGCMGEIDLTTIVLKNLNADLTQSNNRQILGNTYACKTIHLLSMHGVAIKYDYFDVLPYITENLLIIFQAMQEKNA